MAKCGKASIFHAASQIHFNTLVGGRLFPGVHHHARFGVAKPTLTTTLRWRAMTGRTLAREGTVTERLPRSSIFLIGEASFLPRGALGYSDTRGVYDGVELRSFDWRVSPLGMERVECNLFSDASDFPWFR
jgi:hypothetical protein